METNYIIDYKEAYFQPDFKKYLKNKSKRKLLNLLMILGITLPVYIILEIFIGFSIPTSIFFVINIFLLVMLAFAGYDYYKAGNPKDISKKDFRVTKSNLILDDISIKLIQAGRRFHIFYSQLSKVLMIDNTIYFVLKKERQLPLKINEKEMNPESFEGLLAELEKKQIPVVKK